MSKTLHWGKYGFMGVQAHERGSTRVRVFMCLHAELFYGKTLPVVLALCVLELYLAVAVTMAGS